MDVYSLWCPNSFCLWIRYGSDVLIPTPNFSNYYSISYSSNSYRSFNRHPSDFHFFTPPDTTCFSYHGCFLSSGTGLDFSIDSSGTVGRSYWCRASKFLFRYIENSHCQMASNDMGFRGHCRIRRRTPHSQLSLWNDFMVVYDSRLCCNLLAFQIILVACTL